MGCNCGQSAQQYEFVYVSPTGQTTVYKSEVQAQAAKIRNKGGTYTQRPK